MPVNDGVVKCPYELIFSFAGTDKRKTIERAFYQVKAAYSIFSQICIKLSLLLLFRKFAPILSAPLQGDCRMHLLDRCIQPFPAKTGSQDFMAIDNLLPGKHKS